MGARRQCANHRTGRDADRMSISYVQGNGATGSGPGWSVHLDGVVAGDLIVLFVGWGETAGGDITCTASDGTSPLVGGTRFNVDAAQEYGQLFYLLSANAGSIDYGASFSGSASSIVLEVAEFSTDSGAWAFGSANGNSGAGTTSVTTGNVTVPSQGGVVAWGNKLYDVAATVSSPLIGGSDATEPPWSPVGTYQHFYYRILTSGMTDEGTLTYSTGTNWTAAIASFNPPTPVVVPTNLQGFSESGDNPLFRKDIVIGY